MENPMLTFATPTIIAGDRSLTALIAHELAHSWSGNLVTNATWDDFWLNEGLHGLLRKADLRDVVRQGLCDMTSPAGPSGPDGDDGRKFDRGRSSGGYAVEAGPRRT
jgi:leukotriene-A4 hydrolase